MPTWLKYVVSLTTGFATTAGAAYSANAGAKATIISGALGAVVALGNLSATAPKDQPLVRGN